MMNGSIVFILLLALTCFCLSLDLLRCFFLFFQVDVLVLMDYKKLLFKQALLSNMQYKIRGGRLVRKEFPKCHAQYDVDNCHFFQVDCIVFSLFFN
jgi:hypothetical protein